MCWHRYKAIGNLDIKDSRLVLSGLGRLFFADADVAHNITFFVETLSQIDQERKITGQSIRNHHP